jgi:predicted hotdog family 3-hydroxylacyl-ACP dehydratase
MAHMAYSPEQLLPHAAPMILLDEILDANQTSLRATLRVPKNGLFNDPVYNGAVPAWVGIEYMAQAIAAHAGFLSQLNGNPPTIGFLLGSRLYRSNVSSFECDSYLTVYVEEIMKGDNGMAVYQGIIEGQGVEVTARINGFLPANPMAFLQGNEL